VLDVADEDTSIKVSKQARERLAQLAAERQTTLKDVVERLAAETPTAAELAHRERRAREVLAEHFGIKVTRAELAASARLRETIAGRTMNA
jgi:septal ring factor EnvC (AmiA/AmiB activator)